MASRQFTFCHFAFIANFLLELISLILILMVFRSPCIQAGEITHFVHPFLFVIFFLLLPDFLFSLLMLKCFNLGTLGCDKTANMFSFFAAVLGLLIGLSLILTILKLCGNPAQFMIITAGILVLISALIHLIYALRMKD